MEKARCAWMRFAALAQLTFGAGVRAAAPKALALWLGVFFVWGLLAQGNGLRALDLVALLRTTPAARLALWGAWLISAAPIARAALDPPGAIWLRALPATPLATVSLQLALLVLVEAPWALLFAAGKGPLAGVAVAVAAAAAHALALARPRRPAQILAAAALFAVIAFEVPPFVVLGTSLGAAGVAIPAAAVRLAERKGGGGLCWSRSATLALARSHLALLWREAMPAVVRAVVLVIGSGALAALASRNRGGSIEEREAWSLGLGFLGITAGVAALAPHVQRGETALGWLLEGAATTPASKVAAASLTVGLSGAALGALHGLAAAGGASAGRWQVVAAAVFSGGATGVLASWSARSAQRGERFESTRHVNRMLLISAVAAAVTFAEGKPGLVLAGVAAALALGNSLDLAGGER